MSGPIPSDQSCRALLRGTTKKIVNCGLYRVNFPVHEVTVSVDDETGKSVFIDREN